jgi:colanic acid biosynthesis glycosyl transferase WcaI
MTGQRPTKILVLSANYYPEATGVAPICTELCEDLASHGFDVTVLTAFPSYPERVVKEPYRGRWFQREEIRGVKVIRTWMFVTPNLGTAWRVLSFSSFW